MYEIRKILISAVIQLQKIVYLGQLVWEKMLILISTNILDMESDLIDIDFFLILVVELGTGVNVIIFGVDISSSTKIDNRKKDNLILGEGPIQGLEHTLSSEKMYSINFTKNNEKCCLSLHYNRVKSYLFVNGREIYKFKAKDSEILKFWKHFKRLDSR